MAEADIEPPKLEDPEIIKVWALMEPMLASPLVVKELTDKEPIVAELVPLLKVPDKVSDTAVGFSVELSTPILLLTTIPWPNPGTTGFR